MRVDVMDDARDADLSVEEVARQMLDEDHKVEDLQKKEIFSCLVCSSEAKNARKR